MLRVKFLMEARPRSKIGGDPTMTAARASHFNGWYTYLRKDRPNNTPQAIVYGDGHLFAALLISPGAGLKLASILALLSTSAATRNHTDFPGGKNSPVSLVE